MADDKDRLKDYNTVADRLVEFKEKHPQGCLRPLDPAKPFDVITLGDRLFVVYVAAAYRTPDDPLPGIGTAWEPFPGATPFTKNSELQNAETAAWGRAIMASLASSSKKLASLDEVVNREAEQTEEPPRQQPSKPAGTTRKRPPPKLEPTASPEAIKRIGEIRARLEKLNPEHLEWARAVAKEEGIVKYDSNQAGPSDWDKLEGIIALAEVDQEGH